MTAQTRAYLGAIGRFYATGKPVLLPVETGKTGKKTKGVLDNAIH